MFFVFFGVSASIVNAKEYDGGPIKVIYDFIGHYSLNYTGNTNHYDYWNANGTNRLVNCNYIDRTDIPSSNNSVATIAPTDSESTMKAAYLIWQSRSEAAPLNTIGIVTPTGEKRSIIAKWICQDIRNNASGEEYVGVYTMCAEVTDLVCSEYGGYGTYTVANIPVWDGVQEGEVVCGGESVASWQLVVVEESPNFPFRTISLNTLSQYFYNINYTVTVNFADASAPTGDISLQWYNLFADVDSQYRLSGAINWDPAYWHDASNYRYKTPTRGLYKNGISFNTRDTGNVYATGSGANGAIHGHLYDETRPLNNLNSTGIIYLQEGTNRGMCATTLGVAIDVFAYDIVFDGNGATGGSMDNLTCIYGRGYNLTENQYERPYWKFTGWNTKPDGSGEDYKEGQYIRNLTATEDKVMLYAQWKPDTYKITLDSQNAVFNGTRAYYEWYSFGNYSTPSCTTEIDAITLPTKKGFTFSGYYTEKDGQGTKYVESDGRIISNSTTFTQDTTLYAYWTSNIYKITLDNRGADTSGTTAYYEKYDVGNYTTAGCTTEIIQIELPTKKHYIFGGYYTDANGEGQKIIDEDGNIITVGYKTFDKDVTIHAYWKPNTYIISLDSQNATEIGTIEYYEKYGVMNYTNTYVVDSNSEEIVEEFHYTGEVQTFTAPYTGTYKLDLYGARGCLSNGYEYINAGHWVYGDIKLNRGDTIYICVGENGASSGNAYNGGGASGTLYLQNAAMNGYLYVKTGGGGGASSITFKNRGELENFENYKNEVVAVAAGGGAAGEVGDSLSPIHGWNFGIVKVNGASDSFWTYGDEVSFVSGDNILYNKLQKDVENVIMHNNTNSSGEVSYYYLMAGQNGVGLSGDEMKNVPLYTQQGLTGKFDVVYKGTFGKAAMSGGGGWYGGGIGTANVVQTGYYRYIATPAWSGSSYLKGMDNANGYMPYTHGKIGEIYYYIDKTMVPAVEEGLVKITYEGYKKDSEILTTTIKIPQKDGYRFGGYYTGKNGTGTKYVDESGNILSTPTSFEEDTTLYAYWIADTSNTYKIQFHGNGADAGAMALMTCNFEQTYTLTANAFSKKGYTFAGWSTSADGEVEYANQASVKNLASDAGEVITLYAQWTAGNVPYKVNHYTENLIGEWELHSTDNKTGITGSNVTLSDLKKSISGFTYKHAEIKGVVSEKAVIAADGSLIINLYYTRNFYTVTLQKDSGISSVIGEGTYRFEESVQIDAEVLPNYEWSKWSGDFTSTDKEYEFLMPAKDVTMKANTKASVYTVYLDSQKASESGTLQYYEKYNVGNFADVICTTVITDILLPKRTGYIFGGYYTETDGNGTQYVDAGGTILSTATTFTEDTVLYAKWTPITYTIHFEGNGATDGLMDDMMCTYDMQYQLSANQFTKGKFRFIGWNTKSDGSGMSYIDKSYFENLCENQGDIITLYAQWTPNTYIVHFDANGGSGTMEDMECEFHVDYVLNENQFTKAGYDFAGWSLIPDGEVVFADKAVINNLHSTTGIVTLYAQWTPGIVTYEVNHHTENLDAGWTLYSTDALTGYTETVLELGKLVKRIEGFTYKHAEVNGIVSGEATILADGSLVIDLYYTRNSYMVTLDKDEGISSVSGAGTYKYGETVTLDAKVRLGYSWSCWSGTYGTTDKKYVFVMLAEDVMMKANTSPVICEIFLDNQDADSMGTEKFYEKYNVDNYTDASCGTKIEIISLPAKTGYIFEGYYTETEGKGTQYIDAAGMILSTPTTFTEDTILYAYWTPITYIIRFEGNGADGGSMSDMYCRFNQEYSLSKNQFTKEQYHFTGWNTKPDGSGTGYQEQALIKSLSCVQNDVITLYAQWKPNTYEVFFDANGGEGTMDSISLFYDMEQALPESLFTKSNEYGPSTFLGWNTDATATAALFEDEACVMNIPGCENGLVTLYAIWDDCPWIIAEDLYYSLYEAQNGLITYDELMNKATASDKEDGASLQPGVDAEKGTSFTILDYLPTDFTQFTASGSVTETYQVIDSIGNMYKKMITVHVIDTTPVEILPDGTTRFINEKYYNETYENGGLEADSIWKTDPEFVAVIQKAFENSRNDTPIMSFSFTYEEILEMKEFIQVNGIGNSKNPDALQQFYDKFMVPNMLNYEEE